MITVYYDGKCGLCRAEIEHYRKIAPKGIFNWQDVNARPDDFLSAGISLSEGLKLLHARDASGKFHIGVDAFILIWKQLKRWHILAFLISLPGVRQLADVAYRFFAERRFKRLSHCQLALREDGAKEGP